MSGDADEPDVSGHALPAEDRAGQRAADWLRAAKLRERATYPRQVLHAAAAGANALLPDPGQRGELAAARAEAAAVRTELEEARAAGGRVGRDAQGRAAKAEAAQGREQAAQEAADAPRDDYGGDPRSPGGWRGALVRLAGAAAPLCIAAVLGGCSFPHTWSPVSEDPRSREPFPQALRACVAAYDPGRLNRLTGSNERRSVGGAGDQGGYKVYGFSQPDERYRPVTDCMRTKGWGSYPLAAFP